MTDEVQSDVMIDNLDTSVATMDLITAITADIIEKVHNHNQWNKHTNISPTESHVYTVLLTCLRRVRFRIEIAYVSVTFIDITR